MAFGDEMCTCFARFELVMVGGRLNVDDGRCLVAEPSREAIAHRRYESKLLFKLVPRRIVST